MGRKGEFTHFPANADEDADFGCFSPVGAAGGTLRFIVVAQLSGQFEDLGACFRIDFAAMGEAAGNGGAADAKLVGDEFLADFGHLGKG